MMTTNVNNKALCMSTQHIHFVLRDGDEDRARAPGIFISRCAAATMTTTTIGNNERLVSDGKTSCASALHVALRESDDELP